MKIKYAFLDGTVTEVEVSDEIGAVIIDSRKAEHAQDERHRYHCYSYDAIDYEGEEYGACDEYIAALAAVLRDIKGWLYSEPDRYHEITDSYDAEYFRYGVISGSLDIEEQLNKVGSFTVTFNCKPFKYSFAGQQTVSADASELTITNPSAFESRPYIKLYGNGTVVIMIQPQGRGMMISNLDEYIEIDSELMNCFKGTVLKNDTVKGAEFPVFKPGVCTINCTGDVSRIEVIPRWCCL